MPIRANTNIDGGPCISPSHDTPVRPFAVPVAFHRLLWCLLLVIVTYISGIFLPHSATIDSFRRSLTPAGFIAFWFVPFLYWEAFCRFAPHRRHKFENIVSSLGRCMLIFIPAHFVFTNSVIAFRPVFDVRWWPSISEAFGLGIPFGCFCVIAYDKWLATSLARKVLSNQPRTGGNIKHTQGSNDPDAC